MKFSAFKEFREAVAATEDLSVTITRYLSVDLTKILRELSLGLNRKLTFTENFGAFEVDVEITSGAELAIRNQLVGYIPNYRIVVRGGDGSQHIVDGDTEWSQDFVYLKNVGATTATATVLFVR